jgi:amino acid permease
LTGTLGLACIASWNYYASVRLDNLRAWTGMNSYAKVAEAIFGKHCRTFVNVCTISTLLGVCVVYTITFASLFHETPLGFVISEKSTWREILLCGGIAIPMVCAPHLKFFAATSGYYI